MHLKRHRSKSFIQWTLGAIVKDFSGQKCLESIHFEMPNNSCEGVIEKYQLQGHGLVADMGGWVQNLLTALMVDSYLTRPLFTQEIKACAIWRWVQRLGKKGLAQAFDVFLINYHLVHHF
mmetsp:Transcript_2245/g.3857  ORF Transcript_2245/g.3857 Transcript_2245/m.3857 type:complete len:120 (-) Transcript_2245:871-1230(-)